MLRKGRALVAMGGSATGGSKTGTAVVLTSVSLRASVFFAFAMVTATGFAAAVIVSAAMMSVATIRLAGGSTRASVFMVAACFFSLLQPGNAITSIAMQIIRILFMAVIFSG